MRHATYILRKSVRENIFPNTVAPILFYVACQKPNPWCTGNIYQLMDCDGDKIDDPTCSHQDGNFYVVSSKVGCKTLGPNAVCNVKSRGKYVSRSENDFSKTPSEIFASKSVSSF